MELIQNYADQESQSSSSMDVSQDRKDFLLPATQNVQKLMEKHQRKPPFDDFGQWLNEVDKRLYLCLGSMKPQQKNAILESMDFFINKLTNDYDFLIKPKIADILANYIRTYLCVYKYLYKSYEMGKRYAKRVGRILSFYTDFELCASIRGIEYDFTVAERIQLMYKTHLMWPDNEMILDVFINIKRFWRRHRGILSKLLEHFLIRPTGNELPDIIFFKNLIVFKKWLYIEELTEDRNQIREAFIQFIKPKKTICMNSTFKCFLPVDKEGFVMVDRLSNIIDMDFSFNNLTRVVRNAEERIECPTNDIIIIVSDDDDDDDDNSNSSSYDIHNNTDDISNDRSSISTYSTYTLNEVHNIDTISIDSSQILPQCSDSQESIEQIHLVTVKNVETNERTAIEQSDKSETESSENLVDKLLSRSTEKMLPMGNTTFEKLLHNFNETHVNESFLDKATANITNQMQDNEEMETTEKSLQGLNNFDVDVAAEVTIDDDKMTQEYEEISENIKEIDNNEVEQQQYQKQSNQISQEKSNCDINFQSDNTPNNNLPETIKTVDNIEEINNEQNCATQINVSHEIDENLISTKTKCDHLQEKVIIEINKPSTSTSAVIIIEQQQQQLNQEQQQQKLAYEQTQEVDINDDDLSMDDLFSSSKPSWLQNVSNNKEPPKTYSKRRKEKSIENAKSVDDIGLALFENSSSIIDDDALLTQMMANRLNEFKINHFRTFDLLPTYALQQKITPKRRRRKIMKIIDEKPSSPSISIPVPIRVRRKRLPKKVISTITENTVKKPRKRGRKPKIQIQETPTIAKPPIRKRRPGGGRKKANKIDMEKIESLPPTILTRQTYTKSTHFMEIPEGGDCLIEGLIKTRNMKCYPAVKKRTNSLSQTILERKSYVKSSASIHSNSSSATTSNQPFDTYTRYPNNGSFDTAKSRYSSTTTNYKKKNTYDDDCVSSKGIRNPIFSFSQSFSPIIEKKRIIMPSKESSDCSSDADISDDTSENNRKPRRRKNRKTSKEIRSIRIDMSK